MPDYNVSADQDPDVLKIAASPVAAWFGIAFRQASVIGGVVASIFTFMGTHDWKGLAQLIGTHEFLAAVIIILGIISTGYAYVREWFHKKKLIIAAKTNRAMVEIEGKMPFVAEQPKAVLPTTRGSLL